MAARNALKSWLLGRPLATDEAEHQLLRKVLALPIFSSDALSSVAYATEEMMLVLAIAGVAAFNRLIPISLAVATLLIIVVISYRQTIRAYPQGGGSFIVTNENLGLLPGTVAAASLLTDYVLTVAVSVAAGVAAITSAFPVLFEFKVLLAVVFIVLLTVANLRGAKESSTIFAAPTYLFVLTVFTMLVVGVVRCTIGTNCPQAESAGANIEPELAGVTLFLLLRAFASGSTALTGVEAIADGVQAFREPKAQNARATLATMGAISVSMFIGISYLAGRTGVQISEETVHEYGTVISQIGRAVFGGGLGFYLLQAVTAGILVLAANTAYQDFPRLSSILANHRLLPRQFRNRGDRLVFSNGVVALALLAILLILIFNAEVSRLIQLYVVGVFTSFTLSQTGMVRRWLRTKEPGWLRSVVINSIGATATGVVLIVVAIVKFSHGAFLVIIAVPLLVTMMLSIRRHYRAVAAQLRQIPVEAVPKRNRVVILAAHLDQATDRAMRYAELIRADDIEVVHATEDESEDFLYSWERLYPDHRLTVLDDEEESVVGRLIAHIRKRRDEHPNSSVSVVVSERIRSRSRLSLFVHRNALLLKTRLLFEPRVVVTDVTQLPHRKRSGLRPVPLRWLETVVLVSDLTRPIREALAYAIGLGAPVRCVHVDVDEAQRQRLLDAWYQAGYDIPLDVVESPFRSVSGPLVAYLRRVRQSCLPGTVVNAVIPEFIVPGRVGQILHNQTGLAIKGILALEAGIAVTSVPFHLVDADELVARRVGRAH